ncbi:MAG: hypothetical protein ACTSR8_10315 [Promethearchaeota archaeon]
MSEEKEKILDKIGNSLVDFVGNILGENAKEKVLDAKEKVKTISKDGLKKVLEFTDTVINQLDLEENEQIKKARDKVEEVLKDQGLIE